MHDRSHEVCSGSLPDRPNQRLVIYGCVLGLLLTFVSCTQRLGDARSAALPEAEGESNKQLFSRPLNPTSVVSGPLFTTMTSDKTGVEFANLWAPSGASSTELSGPFAGGGVAIGDYDTDGRPDIFLTRPIGGSRLYRNLGDWKFVDVTRASGLADPVLHDTGASFVDIDDDGDLDLYVCCYDGPNRLYVNQGDGTFINRAQQMGLDLRRASVMCSFADYDGDGDLDAYLLTNSRPPKGPIGVRPIQENGQWTVPLAAREHKGVVLRDKVNLFYIDAGETDHLMRNNGDGTFSDASEEAGISGYDIGLSATWLDANGDRFPDLYVANDFFTPDHLWLNNGDGSFKDVIADAMPHTPWYSMGSDSADINNDGLFDLIGTDMSATNHYKSKIMMGNMQDGWFLDYPEPRQYMRNAVYLNTGTSRWMEVAHLTGLANTDWTWAAKFSDLDNDGLVDLFVANGMTRYWFHSDLRATIRKKSSDGNQMALHDWLNTPIQNESNLAYKNLGDLKFKSVGDQWGLDETGVSFGAAMGDLDGDGDLDLVVNNFDQPVSVYRNNSAAQHRLVLRLEGVKSNRFGIGAKVRIETSAGIQVRYVSPHTGFYSSNDPHVHFGLGNVDSVTRLIVDWPSGHQQTFDNVAANRLYTIVESSEDAAPQKSQPVPSPLFKPSSILAGVTHRETQFDDFQRQPLLPNRLSQLGPGMAWGDVDGDGDDDLYVSGAKGHAGQLFVRDGQNGALVAQPFPQLHESTQHEEMASLLFDADGDRDLDLYIVSGGIECEPSSDSLRDRLLLNDGKGVFSNAPSGTLPDLRDSGGVATAADFDRDGDLDLFVGGRSIPGKYPLTPHSRLLRNNSVHDGGSGKFGFTDVTSEVANGLGDSGMVTSALWSDVDGDGWLDLLVTHEWGPIRLWQNKNGTLVERSKAANLSQHFGWWNGIAGGDVDGDGDIDYAVTNFGLNSKYHASVTKPALLYYGDFDGTGKPRIVEAEHEGDELLPVRGKSCSTRAMPFLAERFPTFHDFAQASLDDIYTPKCLADSKRLAATELRSGMLINDGSGRFVFRPLPRLAQASPGYGVTLTDVDCDGNLDLYMVQNFFGPQSETGRMDGGLSLLLTGRGDGTFLPVWPRESGLIVPGDAKSLTVTDFNNDGWPDFVVGINDNKLLAFENAGATRTSTTGRRPMSIRLLGSQGNPTAIGARVSVYLSDGTTQSAEVYAGSGYLSQSSATITFGISSQSHAKRIDVHWPDGTTTKRMPSPDDIQISIDQTQR